MGITYILMYTFSHIQLKVRYNDVVIINSDFFTVPHLHVSVLGNTMKKWSDDFAVFKPEIVVAGYIWITRLGSYSSYPKNPLAISTEMLVGFFVFLPRGWSWCRCWSLGI